MKHRAVIDAGFGDGGKGMVIDHLACRQRPVLNVRFSGGHQVGHTVVANGVRHVFSNFGSATMRGVRTFWSENCTVCPIGFTNELAILKEKGFIPEITIHAECPVVTPMDRDANQKREETTNHGSCGVGFGATLQREQDFYSLRFVDIFYPEILKERLRSIHENYYQGTFSDIDKFLDACAEIRDMANVKVTHGGLAGDTGGLLFEGSQGLLLDQHHGIFPNVTRANTGTKNIESFADDVAWFLVTRAYQTRHGNGFMTNEDRPHNIKTNPNETNVTNKWQGEFRKTLLDVSLLEYGIMRDSVLRCAKGNEEMNVVISCMDHMVNDYRFTWEGEIVHCSGPDEFAEGVAGLLGIRNVYISCSDDGESWKKVAGTGKDWS